MGLKARDIMTTELVTVSADMGVTEAAGLMAERGIGSVLVTEGERLVGIVTEGDLIMRDVKVHFPTTISILDGLLFYPPAQQRFERELRKAVAATVGDVMTSEPVTVDADAPVEDLATVMVEREVSHIPVLEQGRVVGIIAKLDIVRSMSEGT